MSKSDYDFSGKVAQINQRYESLSGVTNDELRQLVNGIRYEISTADDVDALLNEKLIDVYAIVKETAGRLSQGDIVVTANRNDRVLADKLDFVSIEGDKAIYHKRWCVDDVPYEWNMVHYDEQLLGGIHLHYGSAIEMATGEGKTLVATLPVFLNALTGKGVHLMTVNDYLSKRDFQLTRPLYMLFGLSVDCIELYDRRDYERKQAYKADITFGANSSFVFDYLFDHIAIDPKECMQGQHKFAIIDEIDSILIDEADNPHIVSGGMEYYDGEIYEEHIGVVKELIEDSNRYNMDRLNHSAAFTEEGKLWLSEKLNNENLFSVAKTYTLEGFDQLPQEQQQKILLNIRIQNVLLQLLRAVTVFEKDVDYMIKEGKVQIIDQNTGRLRKKSRWEHGLHTAIEVKEGVEVQPDSDGLAVISLKNYFKLYSKISGMSGSIWPVKDELEKVYNLKFAKIPTHLPLIRTDNPLRIFKTSVAKDMAIVSLIESNSQLGRPSLVGTISIKRADEMEKLLRESGLKSNRLDARTTANEAATVAKAGIGNTITLSTSVAGRGTDIKPSDDALQNGGLCVIGTDLFGSVRTDLQLKGRSGRQGNPGSSTFFVSLEDSILEYLPQEDRDKLDSLASQTDGDELSTDEIGQFFELAQEKREEIFRHKRNRTAQKDDTIAPHRAKFYYQRNRVLFDSKYASELVDEMLSKDNISIEEADRHILSLYYPTRILVSRSKLNNPSMQRIYVPYSENRHPFALVLDVDLLLTSEEYFKMEFKRQNLLQIYDKFWKDFVVYVMQDLDQTEISKLDERYVKIMMSIHSIIVSRMTESVTTFHVEEPKYHRKDIETSQSGDAKDINTDQKHTIDPNTPCPCGSGIPFVLCHGSKRNPTGRRRR